MQGIWAVVPVKPFDQAKQRLSGLLPSVERRELAQAMLEDVLDSLARIDRLSGTMVVTTDAAAAGLACVRSCEVFDQEPGGGLAAAVTAAARWLARNGCRTMLALPGDVPGVTPRELDLLLARHAAGAGITLVPAHDRRGTNAVVMTPPDAVALAYGENSFERHLWSARCTGIEPAVLVLPGIAQDLDTPPDVAAFMRRPSPTRTWRRLARSAAFSDSIA
ncbi:MAG: 2-phospho-L-lactate guanylyltransferase [Burkholderiales bacterium]|nr:2-phospho-L-lactate guanylyltransferase [Burkholderiales bacterium]OJX04643.1 MAG: 2-phospho-L-lactate guanylyltransferase [Burkholderiales bacterium 70-64]